MAITLLVADDETTIRQGVSDYLTSHAPEITQIFQAKNGEEALNLLVEHRPDVAILDVEMPLKSGLEVLKEANRLNLPTQVLILSGYDQFEYAQQAMEHGAKRYLLKPVGGQELLKSVLPFLHPNSPPTPQNENQFVQQTKEFIQNNHHQDINLQMVAQKLGITHTYLSTLFNREEGCSFADYLNGVRIERACLFLDQRQYKVYEVAYKVGFHDEKYFSKVFKKRMGCSPKSYQKNGGLG